MKYAVLQTGGKQYKVSEGVEIEVDKLTAETNKDFKFEKVLLYAEDGVFKIGRPHIDGAVITAKVLEQKKGKKIRVAKFKAKARYRKVTGHRQLLTKVLIEKITIGGKTESRSNHSKNIKNQSVRQAQDKKANIKNTSKK